jgi:hypothetical protein
MLSKHSGYSDRANRQQEEPCSAGGKERKKQGLSLIERLNPWLEIKLSEQLQLIQLQQPQQPLQQGTSISFSTILQTLTSTCFSTWTGTHTE